MRGRGLFLGLLLVVATGFAQVPASSDQVWINDILANPSRYWNTTVVVVGQVLDVTANPPGTTRGTYTIFDDSDNRPLTVRTRDLPPVGREFAVTGVIVQNPADATVPLLDELDRGAPGASDLLRYLLIGGAVLFGALLVVLIVMLMRPQPQPKTAVAGAAPAWAAGPTVAPRPADPGTTRKSDATRKLSQEHVSQEDKTRVFMSLGVEIHVEKGPDRGTVFALHKQVTNIGRAGARKNDVELTDDTVSKEQASIFYDKEARTFSVTNQSTTNPTTVNGKLVSEPVGIQPGDVLEMGSTTLLFRKA